MKASERKRLTDLPVLFFDWDGVCNHGSGLGKGCDAHNLDHLWWIREQTECRLVCVSQRRFSEFGRERVKLMLGGLPRVMVDWLEFLPMVSDQDRRAEDIAAYVASAWPVAEGVRPGRWLILDDEVWWYDGSEVRPMVHAVDRQVGLTLHDALRAIRVLTGEIEVSAASGADEALTLGEDSEL